MKKAALVVSLPYQQNRIFDLNNPVNGRDNHLHIFLVLKKEFEARGIDLSTQDFNNIEESDIIIYNDMPKKFPLKQGGQKVYLLALESAAVSPDNFNISLYPYFDKVFTWNDLVVNNKDVIKINYSFLISPLPFLDFSEKPGFLCMVSGNKFSNHKAELYTERIRIIEDIEKGRSIPFDLFGIGWDKAYKSLAIYGFVKKLNTKRYLRVIFAVLEKFLFLFGLRSLFVKQYSSYRGPLSPKIPKLRDYKFNVCYENVGNVSGYITEKIFDCFFAGCIPVYLGAPNIQDYIPVNTFIDRRQFKDNEELLNHLFLITKDEYELYQKNIMAFLKSDNVKLFSSAFNANKIVTEITDFTYTV